MITVTSKPPAVARNATGLHLIGDLYGCSCDERLMLDADFLEAFCKQCVIESGLTIVGSLFHSFGEGGGNGRSGAGRIPFIHPYLAGVRLCHAGCICL